MDQSNSGIKDEPTRKRPTKGFRACWECKRPKLQVTPASAMESGLGGSGVNSTQPAEQQESACAMHIGERLSKLEQLFEKFVCRKSPNVAANPDLSRSSTSTLQTSESPSMADKQPKMLFGILPEISSDSSLASVSEGIASWQEKMEPAAPRRPWTSMPSIRTLVDRGEADEKPNPSDNETTRKTLTALLPSQHDSDVIFESTNGWMILQTTYKPDKDLFVNGDPQSYALDMAAIAREHSIVIARTLLHLAVCICSLPPEFDVKRLSNIACLDTVIESYVTTVTSLVTPFDEMLCTLPGLETLLLLTMYHLSCANLRKAWLNVRRTMNLAQLMGFHRIIHKKPTNPPIQAVENAKILWRVSVDVETYLGLHLRLPFASEVYPFGADCEPPVVHRTKLNALSRQISELDRVVTPQRYAQALALDEKLESLMRSMSKEFWEVPNVPSTARSPESSAVLERLVGQIWHFELKIFVHLPFLLRAADESRYEYSKITALQASRNIILRWFALRNASITQACCRFAELGVFIATVTIALDILIEVGTKETSAVQRSRGGDFAMVCRVVSEMEKLAQKSPREHIAARSAVVLKKLLGTLDPSRRTAAGARLTIPYFGSVLVEWNKPPIRPAFDLDGVTGRKLMSRSGETAGGSKHVPVFSFVSNELWPSGETGAGGEDRWGPENCLDFDIVLFDGLEDRDTDGNWVF